MASPQVGSALTSTHWICASGSCPPTHWQHLFASMVRRKSGCPSLVARRTGAVTQTWDSGSEQPVRRSSATTSTATTKAGPGLSGCIETEASTSGKELEYGAPRHTSGLASTPSRADLAPGIDAGRSCRALEHRGPVRSHVGTRGCRRCSAGRLRRRLERRRRHVLPRCADLPRAQGAVRVECDILDPEALAMDVGEQLENTFGSTHRRFIANRGDFEARFDPRF